MNGVFQQIKDTFELPKDVMHYLVEYVRPKAPPGVLEWDKWERREMWLDWYEYRIFGHANDTNKGIVELSNRALDPLCALCTKDLWWYDSYPVCPPCYKVLRLRLNKICS